MLPDKTATKKKGPKPPAVRPSGLFSLAVELCITAAFVLTLPLAMVALVTAALYTTARHAYFLIIDVGGLWGLWWGDVFRFLGILMEAGFCLLLLRQLKAPQGRDHAWLPVLPLDQRRFHDVMAYVAASMRMRMPKIVSVDVTGGMRVSADRTFLAFFGLGLRATVGLSLAVGLSTRQLVGLLAHEMAFYKGLRGAAAGHLIRKVDNWFRRRQKRDPWNDRLWEAAAWGGRLKRLAMWAVWSAAEISSIPMRFLHWLMLAISTPALKLQVEMADECGARLAGSDVYAEALMTRARLSLAWEKIEAEVNEKLATQELPDNIPLLLARQWFTHSTETVDGNVRSHWLRQAPPDADRVRKVRQSKFPGLWRDESEDEVESTTIFNNFHELARRATMYFYQNDLHQMIAQLRFITVEETIYERRAAEEILDEPRKYFRGLAHPERACCGIVETLLGTGESEALRMELLDCREYVNQHTHQMSAHLREWTKTWRMVRDLEAACALKKAGLHVHKHQLAAFTVGELQEEIERQRSLMDAMENQLRAYEGKLEARMACCLELLAREPLNRLPATLLSVRQTLPQWVMIYESLGLNLPVLRELLTTFGAFQALGATVAGKMDSASYVTTVQHLLPKVVAQVRNIARTLEQWRYPFPTNFTKPGERLSMARFLSQNLHELDALVPEKDALVLAGDRREATHAAARKLVLIVAPFLDRYLNLYHQAYSWVTRAMQMAEWYFADPLEGAEVTVGIHDEKPISLKDEPYDPSWLSRTDPVPDPEAESHHPTTLLIK